MPLLTSATDKHPAPRRSDSGREPTFEMALVALRGREAGAGANSGLRQLRAAALPPSELGGVGSKQLATVEQVLYWVQQLGESGEGAMWKPIRGAAPPLRAEVAPGLRARAYVWLISWGWAVVAVLVGVGALVFFFWDQIQEAVKEAKKPQARQAQQQAQQQARQSQGEGEGQQQRRASTDSHGDGPSPRRSSAGEGPPPGVKTLDGAWHTLYRDTLHHDTLYRHTLYRHTLYRNAVYRYAVYRDTPPTATPIYRYTISRCSYFPFPAVRSRQLRAPPPRASRSQLNG